MAAIDIKSLSVEERLRLMDEIWESLGGPSEVVGLTKAQCEELDRRIEELDRDITNGVKPLGIPFDEALDDIRRRAKEG